MSTEIDIAGLNKAEVLAALFNAAMPQGMGWLEYQPRDMTAAEAAEVLKTQVRFDYLQGRVMKVSLDGDRLRVGMYDRDNGEGAAARALAPLMANRQAV